jgi:broad specificity phosphatase PhoE
MHWIIMRHAATTANRDHLLQGRTDDYPLLTESLGSIVPPPFKPTDVVKIITSPLSRALITALYVSQLLRSNGVTVDRYPHTEPCGMAFIRQDVLLMERAFGDMEGTQYHASDAEHTLDQLPQHPEGRPAEGAETIRDVMHRARLFIANTQPSLGDDDTCLVVTHQTMASCLQALLLGREFSDSRRLKPGEWVTI